MESVYADGKTIEEIMIKGNTVVKGYWNDKAATKISLNGGWFRTGDLRIMHPDGYIKLKDRSKDIIISGGENVSTIEVESILYNHPEILEAAVVGRLDEYWRETPCAFVKLKGPKQVTAESIIAFCRERLPHFMAPKTMIFQDLPKSLTGKVCFVGMGHIRMTVSLTPAAREIDVIGVFCYKNTWPPRLEFLRTGKVDVKPLITIDLAFCKRK